MEEQAQNQSKLSGLFDSEREDFVPKIKLHRTLVHYTKILLIIICVVIATSLLIWPYIFPEEKNLKVILKPIDPKTAPKPQDAKMINPYFTGLDKDGNQYIITADEGVQPGKDFAKLKNVHADITKDGLWISVMADGADANILENNAELTGNVRVFLSSGYELNTSAATVDFGKSNAMSRAPVRIQGPDGLLEAEHFETHDKGNVLIFRKNVKVTIF